MDASPDRGDVTMVAANRGPKHKHLRRLTDIWLPDRDFYVTVCARDRTRKLATEKVVRVLVEEWAKLIDLYGWAVGPYVVMPDHVHFFCRDVSQTKPLSLCVGKWKEWTTKRVRRERGWRSSLWQREFFDHLLRSDESYKAKWAYVRMNPVRAGLVERPEDWPYQGYIDYD